MNFPDRITGPQFADGDLLTFTFDEAQLTMRVPAIPCRRGMIDRIIHQRDFRGADTTLWDHLADEEHCTIPLSIQAWNYEDYESHEDIAHALLDVEVLKHSDREAQDCFALKTESFQRHILSEMHRHFDSDGADERPYWPTRQNNFFAKSVKRECLDGLQIQIDLGGGRQYPVPSAYFSLGRRYSLRIALHFSALHNAGQGNPYGEELLQQFKLDVFDDFLSYIRIEYAPETVALIEQFKKEPIPPHLSGK